MREFGYLTNRPSWVAFVICDAIANCIRLSSHGHASFGVNSKAER